MARQVQLLMEEGSTDFVHGDGRRQGGKHQEGIEQDADHVTHGGQLGILGIPIVPPLFKYMRGMYKVGKTFGYVHSGNGSWFPFRFGCPPEIAVFTLVEK